MKWSDIIYVVIIVALAIFAFRSCELKKNHTTVINDNCDSLLTLIDSLRNLPPVIITEVDTVTLYRYRTVKEYVNIVDTLYTDSTDVRTYVNINDTLNDMFIIDTITTRGTLISHAQEVTRFDTTTVKEVYIPGPPVEIIKEVESVVSPTWQCGVGGATGYINGDWMIAPSISVDVNRWKFNIIKPVNNVESFIFQAQFRLAQGRPR